MTYNSFSDLVTDLIRQNPAIDAPSIDNFSGEFYDGLPISVSEFWSHLVNYLKNEGTIGIQTSPIQEGTFDPQNTSVISVFNYINQKCDLNSIWDSLVYNIKDHLNLDTDTGVDTNWDKYFWNESLNKAIAIFLKTMDPEIAQIYLGKDKNNEDVFVALKDVKNADAGWSFINTWVKPYINIDGDNYDTVRGVDKILSVLKNKDQLQFTNKQDKEDEEESNSWIRLLMPKYLRKVEVEDLNRNFWVIAQTLSAVCAYLFGDNSIKDLFKQILNEIMHLWENVLYLWAGVALVSQKDPITNYIVQVIPVANSPEQGYIKFDNFGTTDQDCITYTNGAAAANWTTIKERVKHIVDQYNDVNLIIIPEIREGNYKHNYYYRVSYPGLIIYDRNNPLEGNKTIDFVVTNSPVSGTPFPVVDLKYESNLQSYNYLDKIGSIYESDYYYNYRFPYSDVINEATTPDQVKPYYSMLRMIPIINFSYNEGFVIQPSSITLSFYDVSKELKDGTIQKVFQFTNNDYPTQHELEFDYTQQSISTTAETIEKISIEKGYYLGELVSYQSIIGLPTITIESEAYSAQQLMFTSPDQAKDLMVGG